MARRRARSPGWRGGASPTGEALPYLPLQQMLADWLGMSPGPARAESAGLLRAQGRELLGDRVADLLPFLGTILGLVPGPGERDRIDALSPEALHDRVAEALALAVRHRAGDAPAVIAVDDAHWADSSSLRLLERLLSRAASEPLLERAGGNPFFLEQLVRSLIDADALVRGDGRWHVADEVRVAVPDTIEKLVLSRVDRAPRATEARSWRPSTGWRSGES